MRTCNPVKQALRDTFVPTVAVVCLLSGMLAVAAAQEPSPAEPAVEAETLLPEAENPDSLQAMTNKYPQIAEAVKKFEARQFDEALALTEAAADAHPELPPGETVMASLHFAARDLAGAIRMLDKAVQNHPGEPSAYLDLGNIAILQNRLTDATLLFDKTAEVLETFDDNAERKRKAADRLMKGWASLAERKDQWADAETHLTALAASEPDAADVQVRLARAMFRNKKYKPAYEMMQASAAVKEAGVSPELAMAQFYSEMQDDESARKWIDYAIRQQPENLQVRLGAVQWHWQRGNAEDVKKHVMKAVDIDPTSLPARMLYGMYAHYAGDLATAATQFEAVLTRSPTDFAARNNLAMVLADRAQADSLIRAKRMAEENLQAAGNNTVAAGTLGWAHYKLGQFEEAAKLMQAVAQAGGLNNRNNIYFMARVADRAGQREQAVELLKQVLDQPQLFEMRGAAEKWLQSIEP